MVNVNITNEPLISLPEAARLLPTRGGKYVSTVTLWRWCTFGLRGVILEHLQFGRRVYTSAAALTRFGQALAAARRAAREGDAPAGRRTRRPSRTRSSARADDRRRRAARVMDEAGVR